MRVQRLLLLLAEGRERGLLRLGVWAFVLAALAPAVLFDALDSWRWRVLVGRVAALEVTTCRGGNHEIRLQGAWTCDTCKLPFEGHGFATACPHCGARAYALPCACSRVSEPNPLFVEAS